MIFINTEEQLRDLLSDLKKVTEIAIDLEVLLPVHIIIVLYFDALKYSFLYILSSLVLGSFLSFLPRVCLSDAGIHTITGLYCRYAGAEAYHVHTERSIH